MVKACKMILVSNLSHGHQTKYLTLLSQEAKAGETRVYPKSPFTLPFDQIMAPAYTAARMPILFGAADFVFRDIAKRLPGFQPKSILDFGTGPGTAIWAARKHFPASLHAAVGIDISAPMLEIAQRFAALPESGVKDFQAVRYLSPADSVPDEDKHDLVVAAFSLSELPSNAVRNEAIKTLWAQTRDMLVLIDRGTPDISRQIGHARQMILDLERATPDALPNAHLIAPRDITRNLKNSKKDSEDIKFSYVVLRRGPRPPHVEPTPGVLASLHMHLEDWSEEDRVTLRGMSMDWPRLIAPPIKAKKKIILDLCTKDAQIHRIVCTKVASKRIGVPSYYSEARKVRWGDLWPHAPTSAVLIRAPIADKLRQEAEKRAERGQEPAGDNLDAAEASETDDVDDTDERGADEKGKRPKRDPLVPRERVSKGSARKEYKKWAEKANKIGA
nr:Methyltransferase-like protein 17, mitochondrial [Polyrhizophydium stewartii]